MFDITRTGMHGCMVFFGASTISLLDGIKQPTRFCESYKRRDGWTRRAKTRAQQAWPCCIVDGSQAFNIHRPKRAEDACRPIFRCIRWMANGGMDGDIRRVTMVVHNVKIV